MSDAAASRACSWLAILQKSACPALEVRTRHWPLLAIERESVSTQISSHQNAFLEPGCGVPPPLRPTSPRTAVRAARERAMRRRASRHTRSPALRTRAIGGSARRPSAWKTESCESFQPCCTNPLEARCWYSTKPIAIAVAVGIDPLQGALDVRPESLSPATDRRCAGNTRRQALRKEASNRRCRNSARTELPW